MAGTLKIRADFSAPELRRLAASSKDASQSLRLLSLAAALDGMSREDAARIGGMDRQTLRDQVRRFNAQGPHGLKDIRSKGHPPQLAPEQLAALAMPYADTEAMQAHLDEISSRVARDAHAVLLLHRAGWHTTDKLNVPKNLNMIFQPSRAPELNPVENVWQHLRANRLSNRVSETYDQIIGAACDAWNKLTELPNVITSIGMREWAHVGQS